MICDLLTAAGVPAQAHHEAARTIVLAAMLVGCLLTGIAMLVAVCRASSSDPRPNGVSRQRSVLRPVDGGSPVTTARSI